MRLDGYYCAVSWSRPVSLIPLCFGHRYALKVEAVREDGQKLPFKRSQLRRCMRRTSPSAEGFSGHPSHHERARRGFSWYHAIPALTAFPRSHYDRRLGT